MHSMIYVRLLWFWSQPNFHTLHCFASSRTCAAYCMLNTMVDDFTILANIITDGTPVADRPAMSFVLVLVLVSALYMQQRLPRNSTLLTDTLLRCNTMVVILRYWQISSLMVHQSDGLLVGYPIISSLLG